MSTPWTPLADGEIALVHLSDLHFGSEESERVWGMTRQFLKASVDRSRGDIALVTGDLVHTPDPKLDKLAATHLDELGLEYFVRPGNHDRHPLGNPATSVFRRLFSGGSNSEFDKAFVGRIPLPIPMSFESVAVKKSRRRGCNARYVPRKTARRMRLPARWSSTSGSRANGILPSPAQRSVASGGAKGDFLAVISFFK